MKMYLLSDNVDTRTGFRLVGVDGAVVHTRDEVMEELEKVTGDAMIGIVAVTEKLASDYPDLFDEMINERSLPLFVTIPDRHGTSRRPDFLSRYVHEAIGIRL